MSKNDKTRTQNRETDNDCESDCPLQPQFHDNDAAVQLTRDKYVQLLIEARETDPGCWPPGLENAAHLLERAREIEERCSAKHGHFEPERLSKKQHDEYLHIHISLDELQNGLEEATSDAKNLNDDDQSIESVSLTRDAWTEITSHPRPENFA